MRHIRRAIGFFDRTRSIGGACLTIIVFGLAGLPATAQEAQWIWSPEHEQDQVPHTNCHFRKMITVRSPERGEVSVVADDSYELFVNGRRVGSGNSSQRFEEHDISRFLSRGRNLIAIRATNSRGTTAGVAARVMIKENGGEWESHSTDETWKTNLRPLPFWNTVLYNDSRWLSATELGRLGQTAPWDVREEPAAEEGQAAVSTERFKVAKDFTVEQVLDGEKTGSLIAMTFNEFGHVIASREGGPLLLIFDTDDDGEMDTVREYCDKVKNCQGILALNGDVYVTADGPDGAGLYRLRDSDRDGKLEDTELLVGFGKTMGEHGAHGITLGPDGSIYVIVGNHASEFLETELGPHRNFYEGNLLPKYEDPGGHAVGKEAPGGVVIRTDTEGLSVEMFGGGFRNPYDLAFNRQGELFVHDSDMESDIGTTWYRPNRLYHVIAGSEFGWRSGWAKWQDYQVDTLPGVLDTGRGSPTGAVFYNHFAFPAKYHGTLFLGDWSEGRILAVKMKSDGGSYTASSDVFVEGRPLNVTDLGIGPEGSLYFTTGGRGTEGGVYRVSWNGKVPEAVKNLGRGMSAAIRQPQIESAWSRQQVAGIRQSLGDDWGKQLRGVVRSNANPWYYRTRALELMQLFGPPPDSELLLRLSKDGNEIVRGKAAEFMGIQPDEANTARLIELLDDPNRMVRREACEALVRAVQTAPLDKMIELLTSDDRSESWAARRLLERLPAEEWADAVVTSDEHRLLIQGGLALMIAHPTREHGLAICDRFRNLANEFVTDQDFLDLLRLLQVTLHRTGLTAADVPELCASLGEEFPSSDNLMNRELVRLLAYLQVDGPMDRYMLYLDSEAEDVEKLHVAMHLRFLENGWTSGRKLQLIEFFEAAKKREGGGSYKRYVSNFQRDFGKTLDAEVGMAVLVRGRELPDAAVGVLYSLPHELDDQMVETLVDLDRSLADADQEATRSLRIGIVAVLARSGDAASMEYLRYVWENEPERRESAAMGLAQQPEGDNWDYLVNSLPILDGAAGREVMRQLATVDIAPESPESVRQVILKGLALKDDGAEQAVALLEHWLGDAAGSSSDWNEALGKWQTWFIEQYPDASAPELPTVSTQSKWKYEELYDHLTGEAGATGSPVRGATVFTKAQCVNCHRYGTRGESLGPDLTSVSKRFMKKEVLSAILYPSHIISDQYASRTLITDRGRAYTGLVSAGSDGELTVLTSKGEKISVRESEIEEIVASRKSVMPDSLLDNLTLEEISDLFAYLGMLAPERLAKRRVGDAAR